MASVGKYDKLEEPISEVTGDKAELIDNDGTQSLSSHSDSPGHLKKPKEVLEAGKALLEDHSRGLRIIVISAFVFSVIITIALILSIYLGPPQIGANAAVTCGVRKCSDIGLQMLEQGGNAVDAAVASMFCLGVIGAESSGLGGGGFMLVHDHKNDKSEVFDFRETAPSQIKASMYADDVTKMKLGPLSVGVPGELKGMETAHSKYGKLSWKSVVSPAAELARNGFHLDGHTEYVFKSPKFKKEAFMKSKLAPYYTDISGELKALGDIVVRTDLAETLEKIADDGSTVFYSGSVADDIVQEIANSDTPGVLTKQDLTQYEVEVRDVVTTKYHEYTVESIPAPGSGPVLLSILNFLEGYQLKQDNMSYHRILEAFKFGYAQKQKLGDPKFNLKAVSNYSNVMISKEEAARLRNKTKNVTMDTDFYDMMVGLPEDTGTQHVSVIDPAELMVTVTTSVNEWFGSMVVTDSGILLNNVMGDFNEPGQGSKLNAVQPGKRPQSSMSPTVVYETGHLCGVRMACGAVNGTRIITGIAQTLLNNLTFGMNLDKAIQSPRLHSQLAYPGALVVEAEEGFPKPILAGLEKMGHTIQTTDKKQSGVYGVLKIKDGIEGVADERISASGTATFE